MHHEWRDCYFHPDDAPSPVDGLLSDCLWGDRYTMFFDSSDLPRLTLDIRMNGQTFDGSVRKCDDPRGSHWSQMDWLHTVCST